MHYLSLSDNQLTDSGLFEGVFNGMPKLELLFLDNNKLTDIHAFIYKELVELDQLFVR